MAHTIENVRKRRRTYRRQYDTRRVDSLERFFSQNRRQMTQVFQIDPLQENIIRGKNGISFRIPAGAFENQWGDLVIGQVKVEIIELTKKSDILLADRATTSGGQLLETGGAFYFGASRDNNPLRLGMPVQASVPITKRVDTPEYMSVFGGRSRSGRFDWTLERNRQTTLEVDSIEKTFNVSIPQPGWINCDHYYRLRRQQHYDLRIHPDPKLNEQEVFLVYRTINTVAKLQRNKNGQFGFPSPIPLPSIIYSLGTQEGQFFQGFHPIIQDPYQQEPQREAELIETELPMEPVLPENIQSNLEEQIRFWDREVTQRIQNRYWRQRYQRLRRWQQR